MTVRWGRVILALTLVVLMFGALWLRKNSASVLDAWSSFVDALADFCHHEFVPFLLSLTILLGLGLFVLWLLSRVVRFIR